MTNKKLPNIVLIVLDTHRHDRLSTYGYHRRTSLNIDDFARRATVFENGISAAQWTTPSHTSMFTGEYPTVHQTLQVHAMLNGCFDTLAKLLQLNGYQTTGFCNNPLVGVLNNGLKRGFDAFYNYCGAVPSVPGKSNRLPGPLDRMWEWYTQQLRRISYPIQNAFAHSDLLFQLSMHPHIVPMWSKIANFKGHTPNSIRDVWQCLQKAQGSSKPQFVFLNLMETHMPYAPPDTFIKKFMPYFKESREARDIIRRYNAEAYRWLFPIEEPLSELEETVFNDIYDTEVNYQDHLLGQLLEFLSEADNTLTIIVADHGDGIGEHSFMGHSFIAYQELVHVPLIIKFPEEMAAGQRITETVSTRRIFHTCLAAANVQVFETAYRPPTDVRRLTLAQTAQGHDPEQGAVFVEAYPPTTVISLMEKHAPQLIEAFYCRRNRWAVYQNQYKLVRLEGVRDELFDLSRDPVEKQNIIDQHPELASELSDKLKAFITRAIARQPANWHANQKLDVENDENISKQLRALGYIE
jgi:arylsulfatase A-like enzyme